MNYDKKLEELLIIFIITSITYFCIKLFFKIVKVTTIEVKNEEEKKEVVEGFIGSMLSLPFDMFKNMGGWIIDSFKDNSAEDIATGLFGFFICCILPLFIYWKFKREKPGSAPATIATVPALPSVMPSIPNVNANVNAIAAQGVEAASKFKGLISNTR